MFINNYHKDQNSYLTKNKRDKKYIYVTKYN